MKNLQSNHKKDMMTKKDKKIYDVTRNIQIYGIEKEFGNEDNNIAQICDAMEHQ